MGDGVADDPVADQLDLTALNEAYPETLAHRMGVRITEASAQRVVGTMPVQGNTQPYGLLHGGASCVLAHDAVRRLRTEGLHAVRLTAGTP